MSSRLVDDRGNPGAMIATCTQCGIVFGTDVQRSLCWRCKRPDETERPGWLPENYFLKLSVFDVGILWGLFVRSVSDQPGTVVPAGVLRLLGKLDEIVNDVYSAGGSDLRCMATVAGGRCAGLEGHEGEHYANARDREGGAK